MRRLDPPCRLRDLAAHIGVSISAEHGEITLQRLATLSGATAGDLSFLADARYLPDLEKTKAVVVLVKAEHVPQVPNTSVALVVPDPYLAFANASGFFAQRMNLSSSLAEISPGADISKSAVLGQRVSVGHGAVIGAGVLLSPGARIGAGAVVSDNTRIGANTVLGPNVFVGSDCRIGADCVVQANTVLGSNGFGYARDGKRWQRIEQLGSVVIGNRVEIGANCCVDRGAIDDTIIEDDCVLDNLIQVAHNVRIGAGSALAANVGIAGSATLGKRVLVGGGAGILGHLEVADDVVLSPMSLVTRSLRKAGFYSGSFPLMDNAQWEKAAATLRRLPDLRDRLRTLEKLSRQAT
jgi:UDP-3-O-[3-hydroxymyristoyl] glucosamine N-acyltransferase